MCEAVRLNAHGSQHSGRLRAAHHSEAQAMRKVFIALFLLTAGAAFQGCKSG